MTHDQTRSASVVALLADIPSTGHLGGSQAQRFTLDGHDLAEQSGAFVDYARYHAAGGVRVVALYPRWRAERARRAVAFARGAMREDTVAAVGVDLSPLALSLIADQLAYLCPYLPAGIIAGLADELPRHTLAGGWLRNVANLATIPISVPQHLGSFAPGVTYLALCSPVPQVTRVAKGETASVSQLPFRPQEPVQVLHSSGANFDTAAFEEQFLPSLQAVAARRLPAQPLGPLYWGSPKYVEFVAFSAHPRALTEPARAVRPTRCTWCGEPTVWAVCRFCGAANSVPAQNPRTGGRPSAPAPAPGPQHSAPPAAPAGSGQPPSAPPAQPRPAAPAPPAPTPGSSPQPTAPRRPHPPEPVEEDDIPVPQALPPLPEGPGAAPPGASPPTAAAPPAADPTESAPSAFRLQTAPELGARPLSPLPPASGGGDARPHSGPADDRAPGRPADPGPRDPGPPDDGTGDPRWAQGVSAPRAPK
ncbi:hypothetical protein [Streptomonospora litoralis]|uniref:Uncharacterized protein n=1 Tax=Streptomonospora litoralis TaxID=2498135 RepID=A0A4P6PYH0_9ACTN|nr:hypothetical protein [Streptomonospora litoralis]QBI53173.1 hypothetical protein EKD16_06880 [Streptomonospora litoralis]